MTIVDLIEIVIGNMPINTGYMRRNGAAFFDTPYELVAIYNTNGVPYIVYQEEGTQYFKGNKGFISKNTVGQLNRLSMSETLGLPFDRTENNQNILQYQDKMLEELGVIQYV